MIWIDFGIICIGQDRMSVPPDMKDILIEAHQRTMDSEPLYNETYNFRRADRLTGCWYNVWLPDPVCYEESFFDVSPKHSPWVNVVPKWEAHVKRILGFYIEESPVHEIAVLLRVEDRSNDHVHPRCDLDSFFRALQDGNVKWNELYYIGHL